MTGSLRVAVVHYHLRPGGVTTVVQRALQALAGRGPQTAVLCGEAPPAARSSAVRIVPGLDYAGPGDGLRLLEDLSRAAHQALGGPPDVWHVHNHSIGKNTALSRVVFELAQRGARLLLQIHDFPEDGRSRNYQALLRDVGEGDPARLSQRLYPGAAGVHYAVLTRRDQVLLLQAGARPDAVHHLPNPVLLEHAVTAPPVPGVWVYPTRAIRRKNLGEFLLWSALADAGTRWQVTLAPRSAEDLPAYERWRAVAAELRLPVEFEVGREHTLAEVIACAQAIVTTSVAEGFGLSYLEPWLAGRPVLGRDLPEITADFRVAGVRLDGLYSELSVPVDWLGRERLADGLARHHGRLHEAYGRACPEDESARVATSLLETGRIDFGRLDEALQEDIVRRLTRDPEARASLQPSALAETAIHPTLVRHNREGITRAYGLAAYGDRLMRVLEAVVNSRSEGGAPLSSEALLDAFLAPERLSMLRS